MQTRGPAKPILLSIAALNVAASILDVWIVTHPPGNWGSPGLGIMLILGVMALAHLALSAIAFGFAAYAGNSPRGRRRTFVVTAVGLICGLLGLAGFLIGLLFLG
jgi:hypothetical protein